MGGGAKFWRPCPFKIFSATSHVTCIQFNFWGTPIPHATLYRQVTPKSLYRQVIPTSYTDKLYRQVIPTSYTDKLYRQVIPTSYTDKLYRQVIPTSYTDKLYRQVIPTSYTDKLYRQVIPTSYTDKLYRQVIPTSYTDKLYRQVIPTSYTDKLYRQVIPTSYTVIQLCCWKSNAIYTLECSHCSVTLSPFYWNNRCFYRTVSLDNSSWNLHRFQKDENTNEKLVYAELR